jgi:hypothetical protein
MKAALSKESLSLVAQAEFLERHARSRVTPSPVTASAQTSKRVSILVIGCRRVTTTQRGTTRAV